jgi:hypothetical protein
MGRRTVIAALVALGVILTGCGGSATGSTSETATAVSESADAAASPSPTAPTPTQSEPAPTEPSATEPAESSESASPTESPSPSPTREKAERFKMPDLVGENLQDAQDELQSRGSFLMDQVDATGEDRWQLLDSNWYVCSQKPAAGKRVSLTAIVKLYVVKLEETCP